MFETEHKSSNGFHHFINLYHCHKIWQWSLKSLSYIKHNFTDTHSFLPSKFPLVETFFELKLGILGFGKSSIRNVFDIEIECTFKCMRNTWEGLNTLGIGIISTFFITALYLILQRSYNAHVNTYPSKKCNICLHIIA